MSFCSELLFQSPREAAIDALHAATAIYTCEPVVDALLARVQWPRGRRRLVDTSCGDGAFLRRALARLLECEPDITDAELPQVISGWEVHPFAAAQAQASVREVLAEAGYDAQRATALSREIVHCADFLAEGPREPSYHVIVGNPPYLRFLNVPEVLRQEYERNVPVFARSDLLHSFLERSARTLHADGELALATADRWLFNEKAAQLREVIGKVFRLAHVERLDAASSFYRPKQRRAGSPPRVHPCAVILNAYRGTPITRDAIFPGAAALTPPRGERLLGEVCKVRIAPWLGTPGVFLIGADVAAGLPSECLVPAVDTDDIRDGELRTPTRSAILTRPGERPPPAVLAHLEREMPRMCARGRRQNPHWLPPEPFHGMDLTQPSLLVPRIARTLRPVRVPPGILPVNHNLSVVSAGAMDLNEIADILSSERAQDWTRVTSAPLENGYRSITTRLLRQLPID
ncbi:MAG: SAM-dependent methyltransferase [Vicinamibacterales bacterium]